MKLEKNKKTKKAKKRFDTPKVFDSNCLFYELSEFLIPKLRDFNKNCLTYPHTETEDSWFYKLNFIADSLEARIKSDYNELELEQKKKVKANAELAAKLLGEIWFDLWS